VKLLILLLFVIVLLSSCAQQLQLNNNTTNLTTQQQEYLSKIPKNWDLSGKISIIHEQENWFARFHWLKQKNYFQLRFTGPLGETYLLLEQKISGQIKNNTLRIGNETYSNQGSVETLLNNYSHILIPINSLQYWIFGRYNGQHAYQLKMLKTEKNMDAIADLMQQHWQINFSRYKAVQFTEQGQQYNTLYPAKIIAKNDEYSIKVFVSSRTVTD